MGLLLLGAGCATRSYRSVAPPPAVTNTMRRQVLHAADAGEGDPVAARWRSRITAEPDNPAPRLALAAHYGATGFPELEMEHLRLAVARFPGSRDAHLALAQALRKAGQPRQGAEVLANYLRANSPATADAEVWNRLGVCYDEAGDWKAGEQAFRTALAFAPRLDYLLNNLGYNLLQQGRVTESVAVLKEAIERNPDSDTARNNLGLALARSRGATVAEALQHFENVADAATARNNLAAALMEQERYDESRRLLQAALDYNRSHAVALANLALLAEMDGRPAAVRPGSRPVPVWRRPVAWMKTIFSPPKGDTP
jgi:Flp pilus assembly protein TadD